MEITHEFNNKIYVFSNEDLKEGDKTFPISNGMCVGNVYTPENFDFSTTISGFPNDPHIIENINYSPYKPYQIKTNFGYGPLEKFFKIKEVKSKNENLITSVH